MLSLFHQILSHFGGMRHTSFFYLTALPLPWQDPEQICEQCLQRLLKTSNDLAEQSWQDVVAINQSNQQN